MDRTERNTMDRRLYFKKIYKNARGRTPSWKDVYRKRCMERLRSSRSQLVDHFRTSGDAFNNNITSITSPTARRVQDVMEVEWVAMSPGTGFPHQDAPQEDDGILLDLIEEIQQELITEEEKRLMDVLNFDAAALASQVALQSEVICPVCQVQGLQQSNRSTSVSRNLFGPNLLVCGCGLSLQGANLTLNTVKSSLENTLSQHNQTCSGKMSFTSTTDTQGANVLITCTLCDWMSFLL